MAGRLSLTALAIIVAMAASAGLAIAQQPKVSADLTNQARTKGNVYVIVRLNVEAKVEGILPSSQAVTAQRQSIAAAQDALLRELAGRRHRVTGRVATLPILGLEVGLDALAVLERSSRVLRVTEDGVAKPLLSESVPLIQADQAWAAGFDGTGWKVAVLDTGVDRNHPFLTGAVVDEACFTHNNSCPDGTNEQHGIGAAAPCTGQGCSHGTHVAGIVAGRGPSFSGVARGASLIAIQVFSGGAGSFTMDQISALEYVYNLGDSHIAAVNMSLGCVYQGQPDCVFTDQAACDAHATATMIKMAIDNLRQAGIATVIASGNQNFTNQISTPGCISSAVSVGSTTKTDDVSGFSNSASFLSLLAPGGIRNAVDPGNICSSIPGGSPPPFGPCPDAGTGGTFGFDAGTSMAAPHVAGAWAILKQSAGAGTTVAQILNALQTTGLQITDTRDPTNPNPLMGCRIQILQALNNLPPRYPTIDVPGPATLLMGINNCGQIVGTFDTCSHGFLLSGGTFTQIDVPGAISTSARGINNSGQIVGLMGDVVCNGANHGFLRSSDGGYTTIDVPGATYTVAYGINDSGQIVGTFTVDPGGGGGVHGFLLSDGTYTTIDVPDAKDTFATGINNSGQIVGYFYDGTQFRGFLLSGGTYTRIEVPGATNTYPSGINDSGQIVGDSTAPPERHGFLLSGGTYTTIDAPGDGGTVAGINASGQIAGWYYLGRDNVHGFLDLSDPGFAPVRRPLAAAVPVGLR